MIGILKFVLARLREPSTYAGAAAIALSLGYAGGASLIHGISEWLIPVLGGVAMAMPQAQARESDQGGA